MKVITTLLCLVIPSIINAQDCRIQVPLGSNATAYGSGVLIDTNRVATNHHVIERVGAKCICYFENGYINGVCEYVNPAHDFAIIKIEYQPKDIKIAAIGNDPCPGQEVYCCGYGGDGKFIRNRGHVAGRLGLRNEFFQISEATSRYGDSGGGVYDRDGNLVALRYGAKPGLQNTHALFLRRLFRW